MFSTLWFWVLQVLFNSVTVVWIVISVDFLWTVGSFVLSAFEMAVDAGNVDDRKEVSDEKMKKIFVEAILVFLNVEVVSVLIRCVVDIWWIDVVDMAFEVESKLAVFDIGIVSVEVFSKKSYMVKLKIQGSIIIQVYLEGNLGFC